MHLIKTLASTSSISDLANNLLLFLLQIYGSVLKFDKFISHHITKNSQDPSKNIPLEMACSCLTTSSGVSFYGCMDKHFFDKCSVSYCILGFTFGILSSFLPYFTTLIVIYNIMITIKLFRCFHQAKKILYPQYLIDKYGTLRYDQTLISICGDLISLFFGFHMNYICSYLTCIIILACLNIWSMSVGADFVSFISWNLDLFKLRSIKVKYLPMSELEKLHSKSEE
jgi:hypothetical protein